MKVEKIDFGSFENVDENKEAIWQNYHHWFWKTEVHDKMMYRGVKVLKTPGDLFSYQEIIHEINASLIIEFGIYQGGSTLYFHDLLKAMGGNRAQLAVDLALDNCSLKVRNSYRVNFMGCSSTDSSVAAAIRELRRDYPGKVFCILDSDHHKDHVLAEMELLRPILTRGDYLIVEDSNLGGNPVAGEWAGNSPFDARAAYFEKYPDDYKYDTDREMKFGFTYATKGFLIRR